MKLNNTSTTLGWNKDVEPKLTIKQLYAISDAIAGDPQCKKQGAYLRIRQIIRHRENENFVKWTKRQAKKTEQNKV